MKSMQPNLPRLVSPLPIAGVSSESDARRSLTTRFGESIDVRNRGALRVARFAGSQMQTQDAPAVVRLWTDEHFRELSTHQARALAAQLLAAASLAELQNSH
ncbi:MAG: hypothetical protein JSS58_09590 [Proteobacteria bacterium]|nr:hypothetical protein [Pseudomonadota bacterium]